MNLKISEILKNITFVSILLGCIGILINNINLSSYNIPVFDTFDSRVIYIGFVYLLFITGHILIYAMFFDYKELHNNKFITIVSITLLKVTIVSNLAIIILAPNYNELTNGLSPILSNLFYIGIASSLNAFLIISIGYQYIKNDKDKYALYVFKIPLFIFTLISIVSFISSLINIAITRDIVIFELYFAFLFVIGFSYIVAGAKDKNKGLKIHTDTVFSSDINSRNIFDKILLCFCIISVILLMTNNYTHNIYKNIDKNKGGGRVEQITICTEKDTIKGNLIFQSSKYIFLEKDSILIKVDWDKIKEIRN